MKAPLTRARSPQSREPGSPGEACRWRPQIGQNQVRESRPCLKKTFIYVPKVWNESALEQRNKETGLQQLEITKEATWGTGFVGKTSQQEPHSGSGVYPGFPCTSLLCASIWRGVVLLGTVHTPDLRPGSCALAPTGVPAHRW